MKRTEEVVVQQDPSDPCLRLKDTSQSEMQRLASVANNIQIDNWYFPFQVQDNNEEQKSQGVHFSLYKATFDEEQV